MRATLGCLADNQLALSGANSVNDSLEHSNSAPNCNRMTHRKFPFRLLNNFTALILLITIFLASTGTVCTHKIQTEEECLSSNVLCYECDSRYDVNCADAFEFFTLDEPIPTTQPTGNSTSDDAKLQRPPPNETNQVIPTLQRQAPRKKLPPVVNCHGCCVKLTSRMPDGTDFVKRTCTSNLQINYFMVGIVCMKESGDRGKMCFCENDYCNGQMAAPFQQSNLVTFPIVGLSTFCMILSIMTLPLANRFNR